MIYLLKEDNKMLNPNVRFAKSKGIDLPLMKCYLAGFMAGDVDKECKSWRLKVRNHYKNWDVISEENPLYKYESNGFRNEEYDKEFIEDVLSFPIAFLDPYNGPEAKSIDPKGLTSNIPANAIRDGDKLSVKHSDIVVVNIDNFGQSRASWGTPTEMAWAIDKYEIPVICIVPEHLGDMNNHPFIGRASWIVSSVDEMLELGCLEYFYKRMAGAIY
jgi:hypothetical protein